MTPEPKKRPAPVATEDELVRTGLPFVDEVARRLCAKLGGIIDLDELKAMGREALVTLARQYDAGRAPYAPYLRTRLRWAVLDRIRRELGRDQLRARAGALTSSAHLRQSQDASAKRIDEVLPASQGSQHKRLRSLLDQHALAMTMALACSGMASSDSVATKSPESQAHRKQTAERLRAAVARLPDERERALIERHYFGDERLSTIAEELGVSRPWASRLHARAIRNLANDFRAHHDHKKSKAPATEG